MISPATQTYFWSWQTDDPLLRISNCNRRDPGAGYPGDCGVGIMSREKVKEPNLRTISGRLYYARMLRGLNQTELAKKSGWCANTISNIERGKSTGSVHTLKNLAVTLDIPISWLIFGKGKTLEE